MMNNNGGLGKISNAFWDTVLADDAGEELERRNARLHEQHSGVDDDETLTDEQREAKSSADNMQAILQQQQEQLARHILEMEHETPINDVLFEQQAVSANSTPSLARKDTGLHGVLASIRGTMKGKRGSSAAVLEGVSQAEDAPVVDKKFQEVLAQQRALLFGTTGEQQKDDAPPLLSPKSPDSLGSPGEGASPLVSPNLVTLRDRMANSANASMPAIGVAAPDEKKAEGTTLVKKAQSIRKEESKRDKLSSSGRHSTSGKPGSVRIKKEGGDASFPGIQLKKVANCPLCGKPKDMAGYLRCASCKQDTCSSCTQVREMDGKQKLLCESCVQKYKKELALKRSGVAPKKKVVRPPGWIDCMVCTMTALVQLEGRPAGSCPALMEWLGSQIFALGGENAEGIFRLSASGQTLQELRDHVVGCTPPNYALPLGFTDVLCVAALLKLWLRELPEPIFPAYDACIPPVEEVANDDAVFEDVQHFIKALETIPPSNKACLFELCRILLRMGQPATVTKTKMGIENLVMVFSQCLFRNPSSDPFCLLKNQPREHRFLASFIKFFEEKQLE